MLVPKLDAAVDLAASAIADLLAAADRYSTAVDLSQRDPEGFLIECRSNQ